MSWKGRFRNGLFALALAGLIAPQANAIEIVTGANAAGHLGNGLITYAQVRTRGGGPRHGGAHRGGMRTGATHGGARYPGGAHRGAAHVNVNRNISRNATHTVNRNVRRYGYRGGYGRRAAVLWAGRPGYSWAPGGAVAAGEALGFVTAATAAAWAGAPPEPGLCWYYTDPSRRQGFWDVCF